MTWIGESNPLHSIALPGRSETLQLAWGVATDVGRRREINEDSVIARPPVFAVADGMGGHSAGDLASRAVVTRLDSDLVRDWVNADAVEQALIDATDDITRVAGDTLLGVGTTVTGVALALEGLDPSLLVFNVGDSRVYLLERNELRRVTVDHSVVQELVDAGELAAEDAENHPEANIITRAVGFGAPPFPDFWSLPLRTGMRVLVCSDGLTREVDDERIRLHLAAGLSVAETAGALVDAALAAGGRDNVTTIVLEVVRAPARSAPL